MEKAKLEVCAGTIASVKAAAAGGAWRVELCSALDEGGLTPSVGLMKAARSVPGLLVNVLIRPRGGDFVYSEEELAVMESDITVARETGLDGVVIGALLPDGSIDMDACRRLIKAAGDMSITFHRAFDMARNPEKALEDIISLGCDTLLTSGQSATAEEGIPLLQTLCRHAGSRIKIMAGSGVNSKNAEKIQKSTGCPVLHASARKNVAGKMEYRKEGVNMGAPGADEFSIKETSEDEVRRIVESLTQAN